MSTRASELSIDAASAEETKNLWRAVVSFAAVVLAPLVVFYFPVLTGRAHYFMSDHCFYFQPLTHYIGERLRHGELPLWNPFVHCGMSQIAIPSPGVFYPPTWLFAGLNYSQGVATTMILHQTAGAVGCFLLVSSFGWGVLPAALCGLAFAFSGYMFTLLQNYTIAADASWIPLMLWSFRQIVNQSVAPLEDRSGNIHRVHGLVGAAAIFLFLLVAAGRPEVSIPAVALLGIWLAMDYRRAIKYGALKWQLLAILIAALLGSVIVLPTLEWVKLSTRANGLNLSQVLMWSANWYDFICLFFVQPFGDLQRLGSDLLVIVSTRPVFLQYIPNSFVGTVVATLAVWGFADKDWRMRWTVALLLGGGIVMCVGEYWPVAPFLVTHIKALSVFRYPIKWMIFPILCIAIAASRGLYCVERSQVSKLSIIFTWVFWSLVLTIAIAFFLAAQAHKPFSWQHLFLPVKAEMRLAGPVALGCVVALAVCAFEWLGAYGTKFHLVQIPKIRGSHRARVLLGAAALSLLFNAFATAQMTVKDDFFARNSYTYTAWQSLCAKYPGPHRLVTLLFDPLLVPKSYPDQDPRFTEDYYQYSRQVVYPNISAGMGLPETTGYEASETGWFRKTYLACVHNSKLSMTIRKDAKNKDVTGDMPIYRFCQATSTQFAETQIRTRLGPTHVLDPDKFEIVSESEPLNIRLYQLKNPIPRAYFTPSWQWVADEDKVYSRVVNAQKVDFDPTVETLINRKDTSGALNDQQYDPFAPKLPTPPVVSSFDGATDESRQNAVGKIPPSQGEMGQSPVISRTLVAILQDRPEHITVSLKTDRPGFVVLTDHFYPGWHALVDSIPQLIYKANMESRAVYVGPGSHVVEFNYEPDSLKTSLLLCAFGGLLCVALLLSALWPAVWRMLRRGAGENV